MSRPEYINCVRRSHVEHANESWCGRKPLLEWAFVDPAHAAENGQQDGYLVACPKCVDAITKALRNGAPVRPST